MKRLLLLIAVSIVWSGSVLQAQEYEYVPLVREGIEWGYKNGEIYRFIGEEIINGKVYKQLGNSSRDYPDSYKIAGYAREENKVVYRLYSKDAEEVPIYHFNGYCYPVYPYDRRKGHWYKGSFSAFNHFCHSFCSQSD